MFAPSPRPPRPPRPRPPTGGGAWRARWQTFWRAEELDEALAAGSDPLSSPGLLWRAHQLTEPTERIDLATAIEGLVEEVDRGGPPPLPGPAVLRRDVVAANRTPLLVLAARLRDGRPHALRGLARVRLLLDYGDSALYRAAEPPELKRTLFEILAALDPAA